MTIKTITVTGADESTSFVDLRALVDAYPGVEIGLLYTCNPDGRGRYPSRRWIEMAAHVLSGRVALHVCGKQAREQLLNGELGSIVRHTPRVQVNGYLTISEVHKLCSVVPTLITQHNESNAHLIGSTAPNHSLLVDSSGGNGLSPAKWIAPRTAKKVGFAGGLGMKNLVHEFSRIADVAAPGAWLDMESSLRSAEDKFDIAAAICCAEILMSLGAERAAVGATDLHQA